MMLFVDVAMFKHPLARLINLDVGVSIIIDAFRCNALVVMRHMALLELRFFAAYVKPFYAFVPRCVTLAKLRLYSGVLESSAVGCCQILGSLMQLESEGFGIALGD
jgi:hypothetical protein